MRAIRALVCSIFETFKCYLFRLDAFWSNTIRPTDIRSTHYLFNENYHPTDCWSNVSWKNVCLSNAFSPNVYRSNASWPIVSWSHVRLQNLCWPNVYHQNVKVKYFWPNVSLPNVCWPNVCQPNVWLLNLCCKQKFYLPNNCQQNICCSNTCRPNVC